MNIIKKITKNPCLFFLLVLLLGAGCKKDLFLELPLGSSDAIINKEINNIVFKFYLLNEQDEPATVFNQGENFTFHFEFINRKRDSITVTTEFINADFFRIYKNEGNNLVDMGKPWTGIWCLFNLEPHEFYLSTNESIMIYIPWVYYGNFRDYYPLCCSETKSFLPQGKYYTAFNLDFHYTIKGKKKTINNATFKINFEIK